MEKIQYIYRRGDILLFDFLVKYAYNTNSLWKTQMAYRVFS